MTDQVRGRKHCAKRSVAIEQFPCADALLLPTPLKVAEDSEAMPDRVTYCSNRAAPRVGSRATRKSPAPQLYRGRSLPGRARSIDASSGSVSTVTRSTLDKINLTNCRIRFLTINRKCSAPALSYCTPLCCGGPEHFIREPMRSGRMCAHRYLAKGDQERFNLSTAAVCSANVPSNVGAGGKPHGSRHGSPSRIAITRNCFFL